MTSRQIRTSQIFPPGGCVIGPRSGSVQQSSKGSNAAVETICLNCGVTLYEDGNHNWCDFDYSEQHCWDEDHDCPSTTKHDPDLCSDGTPNHDWVGGDEQMCSSCGSVRENPNNVMPVNHPSPGAPSNPAIMTRFNDLMEKRKMEMEARKTRTYRESMGDLFEGMRFQGGEDPDPKHCPDCGIQFDDVDLKNYHDQQVHQIGVTDEDEDDDA